MRPRQLAARHGLAVQHQERRVMAFVLEPLGTNVAIAFYGGEWAEFFEGQCAGRDLRVAQRAGGPSPSEGVGGPPRARQWRYTDGD